MNNRCRVYINGVGAVSPAGWGAASLLEAIQAAQLLPRQEISRPGWPSGIRVRQVPPPATRPAFLAHPRLRRSSAITQFAAAAALEALGEDAAQVMDSRLGIILGTVAGTINYSRRFYDETLRDPATASPLIFPETVFNAPASHLAACLGSTGIAYTLMGDSGVFLQGVALAAQWLRTGKVDRCLVIGAEEIDWLTADAFRHFNRAYVMSDGAGALHLTTFPAVDGGVELDCITEARNYSRQLTPCAAMRLVREELGTPRDTAELLCDGLLRIRRIDQPELDAWAGWPGPRCSPKVVLGEGLAAAAAWQCIAAIRALQAGTADSAIVSVSGCNQQAVGARFQRGCPAAVR